MDAFTAIRERLFFMVVKSLFGRTQPFSRIDHASGSAPQIGGALNENPATVS